MKKEARLTFSPQAIAPLLVNTATASKLLSVSRAKFYNLAASGAIGPTSIDLSGCKRYRLEELKEWVANNCPGRDVWLQRKISDS
jgi:predicted DNA-binding transcriptional regulator AlpA